MIVHKQTKKLRIHFCRFRKKSELCGGCKCFLFILNSEGSAYTKQLLFRKIQLKLPSKWFLPHNPGRQTIQNLYTSGIAIRIKQSRCLMYIAQSFNLDNWLIHMPILFMCCLRLTHSYCHIFSHHLFKRHLRWFHFIYISSRKILSASLDMAMCVTDTLCHHMLVSFSFIILTSTHSPEI